MSSPSSRSQRSGGSRTPFPSPSRACSRSTGSSCRRCTRSRSPTGRTGSRSPSTSRPPSWSRSSRGGRGDELRKPSRGNARPRCSPMSPPSSSGGSCFRRSCRRSLSGRRPCWASRPRGSSSARSRGPRRARRRTRSRQEAPPSARCTRRSRRSRASPSSVACFRHSHLCSRFPPSATGSRREAFEAEALRRSDTIKTAVIQAVSHDLRTPLATIEAALDGLESGVLELDDSDREALLETIRVEHGRLKRLVDNLLDLSRLEADAAPPTQELWTADELVSRALEEFDDTAGRIQVSIPRDSPAIRVDAIQVQRILANLIDNALKFSPSDEPVTVRVNATRSELLIRVVDHGPGVLEQDARADLPGVPEARRRPRRARGRAGPGDRARLRAGERRPGLGRVEARPGSLVRARLPDRRGSGGGAQLNGQRVLVVDDEPQFLRALQTNLRGAGYDVATATTAAEALSSAGLHPPEAIILDLVLPDGRGTDVCPRAASVDEGADHRRVGGGRGGREDLRARRRRGRLRHEALLDRRAARAAPRRAPPLGGAGRAHPGSWRAQNRPRQARRDRRRERGPPDAARVRPAPPSRPERREADDAQHDPPGGVGPRLPA